MISKVIANTYLSTAVSYFYYVISCKTYTFGLEKSCNFKKSKVSEAKNMYLQHHSKNTKLSENSDLIELYLKDFDDINDR